MKFPSLRLTPRRQSPYQEGLAFSDLLRIIIILSAIFVLVDRHFFPLPKTTPVTTADIRERLQETKAYIAILATIDYYKAHSNNNGYNQDAAHLLQVWNYCQDYATVITDIRWIDQLKQPETYKEKIRAEIKAIDVPLFMFCVCSDEAAFHPGAVYTNKNNTQDSGITQINQARQAEINQLLPKDLQTRPWTDTEKNIAGRYVWIMTRVKDGMAWDIMTRQRGWTLYKLISKKIKNFKLEQGGTNECN
jgi:hypothetical protein